MSSLAIGIDLGTAYSCVGVYRNDQFEIIPNEHGHVKTPNYVAFVGDQLLVGEDALAQADQNPTNTIFNLKKLIGRRFTDPQIQQLKE
jgi:molecular chaperone DnaK (HSP70)